MTGSGWVGQQGDNKDVQLGGFQCIYPVENP